MGTSPFPDENRGSPGLFGIAGRIRHVSAPQPPAPRPGIVAPSAWNPLSTWSTSPVTPRAASDSRNAAASPHLQRIGPGAERRVFAVVLHHLADARNPRGRERLRRARRDRVHPHPSRAQIGRQVADRRLERRLRDPHHVVVGYGALAAQVAEREGRAAAVRLEKRREVTDERGERIDRDVMGDPEPFPGGGDEVALEVLAQGVGDGVDQEIEAAEVLADGVGGAFELLLAGDVERQGERARDLRRQLVHVALEALVLEAQGERRALARRGAGDPPREGAVVRDPDDQSSFVLKQHCPAI